MIFRTARKVFATANRCWIPSRNVVQIRRLYTTVARVAEKVAVKTQNIQQVQSATEMCLSPRHRVRLKFSMILFCEETDERVLLNIRTTSVLGSSRLHREALSPTALRLLHCVGTLHYRRAVRAKCRIFCATRLDEKKKNHTSQ